MVSGATDSGLKPAAQVASGIRAAQTALLEAPVTRIRFAKGKRAESLHKLGIHTLRDLLTYYPQRYNDFSQVVCLAAAPLGEKVSVLGVVDEVKLKRPKPRMTVVEISIVDGTGVLIASWFN
ncbi:MAG: ATP-dependent DNA helicase RecG, partial [Coriobacteriales bacterium]|nr:ATP-dependent DNA helicase RecG [Coriobacteriales bacterium]